MVTNITELEQLIQRVKAAQQTYSSFTQEQLDTEIQSKIISPPLTRDQPQFI